MINCWARVHIPKRSLIEHCLNVLIKNSKSGLGELGCCVEGMNG